MSPRKQWAIAAIGVLIGLAMMRWAAEHGEPRAANIERLIGIR